MGAGGPRLYFMKDADAPPHGVIDLRSCLTVKTADEKTGKPHSFEVATGEQVFFMCADTAAAKDEVRGCCARQEHTAAPRPPNPTHHAPH